MGILEETVLRAGLGDSDRASRGRPDIFNGVPACGNGLGVASARQLPPCVSRWEEVSHSTWARSVG